MRSEGQARKPTQKPTPPEPTKPFGDRYHACFICTDRGGNPWTGLRGDHPFKHDQAPRSLG